MTDWLDKMDQLERRVSEEERDWDAYNEMVDIFHDHARELIDATKGRKYMRDLLQQYRDTVGCLGCNARADETCTTECRQKRVTI